MASKTYKITVTSFTSQTPCDGFYVQTGLTQNISESSPINGTPTLIPITTGYTFNVDVDDIYEFIFIFIIHCDGYDVNQNLQGGYQVSIADLRCTDCFKGNCSFDVIVEILSAPIPPVTPTKTSTPTPTVTPTKTPTPTPTSTQTYKSWTIQRCVTGPCVAGQCACGGMTSATVYTIPSVTSLTTIGITIYTNTSLTTTFDGYYLQGGFIYEAISGVVSQYCENGVDPC